MSQRNSAPPPFLKSIVRLAIAPLLSFVIYGCSVQAPSPPPLPPVQPPPPPPPVAVVPATEGPAKITTASFYGPGLQGHVTSSGEIFDQHALTAASRTLPIGSHAKVTNLKTGKSVVVRINDHGPFVKGRGIDLSRAAAKHIGIDHHGVAKVKVTRIEGAPTEEEDSSASDAKIADNSHAVPVGAGSPASPSPPVASAVTSPPPLPLAVEPAKAVSPSP
jgi:rare lipoprotein A (peptidoglycan hydrolase)